MTACPVRQHRVGHDSANGRGVGGEEGGGGRTEPMAFARLAVFYAPFALPGTLLREPGSLADRKGLRYGYTLMSRRCRRTRVYL